MGLKNRVKRFLAEVAASIPPDLPTSRTGPQLAGEECEDDGYAMRAAHREVAYEILGRKQALLDSKFNGTQQSLGDYLAEAGRDAETLKPGDLPTQSSCFHYRWNDKTKEFEPA